MDKKEEVHMSTSPKDQKGVWKVKKKYVLIKDLSSTHLQRAKMFAQKKQLLHFNAEQTFARLVDQFDKEAERRGIKLKDWDDKFFKNEKVLKKASKDAD